MTSSSASMIRPISLEEKQNNSGKPIVFDELSWGHAWVDMVKASQKQKGLQIPERIRYRAAKTMGEMGEFSHLILSITY